MHACHKSEKMSPFCRLPQTDGYLGPPFASPRRRTFGPSADRSWGLAFWCVVSTFRFDPVADKSVTKHAQDEYVRESNKKKPHGERKGEEAFEHKHTKGMKGQSGEKLTLTYGLRAAPLPRGTSPLAHRMVTISCSELGSKPSLICTRPPTLFSCVTVPAGASRLLYRELE